MTANVNEIVLANADEQAIKLAETIGAQLTELVASKGSAVLAVSGGRSPIPFFEALSKQDLAWDKITLSLVDERVVATNHEDSNTNLLRTYLQINHAKNAPFHGLLADDLTAEQLDNPAELAKVANGEFIQPDIIVLGMGTDGHTASLFPHVADLSDTSNILTCKPETAPYHRLSLTLDKILASTHLYLAIGGEAKQKVYDEAKAQKTADYPISYVLHQDVKCVNVYTF